MVTINSHCFAIDCVKQVWSDPDSRVIGPGELDDDGLGEMGVAPDSVMCMYEVRVRPGNHGKGVDEDAQ